MAAFFLIGWYSYALTTQDYFFPEPTHNKPHHQDLRGLGYLSGYEKYSGETGVIKHTEKAWEGYNLYVSGHKAEAYLMNNSGRVIHKWTVPVQKAFPQNNSERLDLTKVLDSDTDNFRKAIVSRSGNLFAIFPNRGIVKADSQSRVLWSRENYAHHDLMFGENNELIVLTKNPRAYSIHANEPKELILDDEITILNRSGKKLDSISIADAIKQSRYSGLLSLSSARPDIFHTNTVKPGLRQNELLISMRPLSTIATIDRETNSLIKPIVGLTNRQHDPTYLENDNLLVFDNSKITGQSRVVEIDPESEKVVWQFGQNPDKEFYSNCCGTAQRLPNGNTLITITETGRAIEVTKNGEIVWEFYNPHVDDEGHIGSLFEVKRYPNDYFNWP